MIRQGDKPKIPSPDPDPQAQEELLDSEVMVGPPAEVGNGAHIFWSCGFHLLGCKKVRNPEKSGARFPTGLHSYDGGVNMPEFSDTQFSKRQVGLAGGSGG